jgi:hypothetical protein
MRGHAQTALAIQLTYPEHDGPPPLCSCEEPYDDSDWEEDSQDAESQRCGVAREDSQEAESQGYGVAREGKTGEEGEVLGGKPHTAEQNPPFEENNILVRPLVEIGPPHKVNSCGGQGGAKKCNVEEIFSSYPRR